MSKIVAFVITLQAHWPSFLGYPMNSLMCNTKAAMFGADLRSTGRPSKDEVWFLEVVNVFWQIVGEASWFDGRSSVPQKFIQCCVEFQ